MPPPSSSSAAALKAVNAALLKENEGLRARLAGTPAQGGEAGEVAAARESGATCRGIDGKRTLAHTSRERPDVLNGRGGCTATLLRYLAR